jgi:hypothetical protein
MTMRLRAIALGALLAVSSAGAFAQYYERTYPTDPDWVAREQAARDAQYWNDQRSREEHWRDERARDYQRGYGQECWNPHARHFEEVRPGERQDDLDFSRCRPRAGWDYRR